MKNGKALFAVFAVLYSLVSAHCAAGEALADEELDWYDARELQFEGQAKWEEMENPYDRLRSKLATRYSSIMTCTATGAMEWCRVPTAAKLGATDRAKYRSRKAFAMARRSKFQR